MSSVRPSLNTNLPTTQRPLRVLVVTGAYPTAQRPHWGTFIKSQVESLIAAGVEIDVLHPKTGFTPLRYGWATAQVLLKTSTRRFDVVHGHYGLWCLVARMQWRVPVVASFLGSDLLGSPHADGSYSRKAALVARVSRWLCRLVDAVIVKSEGMKNAATGDNVHVIPNGVDFDVFHPIPRAEARAALGWNPDGYYVLFCNKPERPVKDFSLAQAALASLQRRGIPAELVVASGLPQTTVVQYMNACNALLLTSIQEGSPNVVKEAMACGVPVVSTDVGDVGQVIARTQGCSVCPRDPEALAAALERALRHLGPTTGRSDIRHLESACVAKQIIAVYEQVIRANTSSLPRTARKAARYVQTP